MKQKSPLAVYLHRLEAARKDLLHRKHDVVNTIHTLDSHYDVAVAAHTLPHQRLHNDTNDRERGEGKGLSPIQDGSYAVREADSFHKDIDGGFAFVKNAEQRQSILQDLSSVYNHHRRRLDDLAAFLNRKTTEVAKIKRNFQNDYPLTLREPTERNLPGDEDDVIQEEEQRKRKDGAVRKMRLSLRKVDSAVASKLKENDDPEFKEFCDVLRHFQADHSDRGRSRTKKTARASVATPQRKADDADATRSARSSSVSKERLLIRAKHVRAAKKAASMTDESSIFKAPPDLIANESVELVSENARAEPEVPLMFCQSMQVLPSLDESSPAKGSQFWTEGHERSAVGEKRTNTIKGLGLSARGRSKLEASSSVGEWQNGSSLLTLSTVSATLGDSSLQTSDTSGGARLNDTDSSALARSTSHATESSDWSRRDASSQDESARDSANSDKSSSTYPDVGPSGPQKGSIKPELYRPPHLRSNYTGRPEKDDCHAVPPRFRAAFSSRRSQSYHWQRGEQAGCFSRDSSTLSQRRAQSSHPSSRHISRGDVFKTAQPQTLRSHSPQSLADLSTFKQCENHAAEQRAQSTLSLAGFSTSKQCQNLTAERERPIGVPLPDQQSAKSFVEQGHPCRPLEEDEEHVVTVTRFHQAEDYSKQCRRTAGSTSGCSSGESIGSSTSRRGSEDSFDCDYKASETTAEEEVTSASRREREVVVVKLVRMEDIQRHRGPGLMDTAKQTDSFIFHKERTLHELSDFIHSRMGVINRGRLRLWLFEEDEGGMFLPRRMLKGHFNNTLGSLNRPTVTLFVQMAEKQERLFSVNHSNIRFVFVKAPSADTGNFVVKGHHNVDVSKATRAVIQVLKKKFMPECQSPLKLFIEMGGNKMMVVPHSPTSTLHDDTGSDTRHGDVFVLLEDFIGSDSLFSDVSSASSCNQSHRGRSFIAPLSPHHALQMSRDLSSYDLEPSSLDLEPPGRIFRDQQHGDDVFLSDHGCHDVTSDVEDHDVTHDEKENRSADVLEVCDAKGVEVVRGGLKEQQRKKDATRVQAPAKPVQEQLESTIATSQHMKKFVIPYDCATSTSDDSLAPASPENQKSSNTRPVFPLWDLTSHYLARFHDNRFVKKESEPPRWQQRAERVKVTEGQAKVTEGHRKGREASFAEMTSDTSGVDCVEYDSAVMYSRPDVLDSMRYDSVSAGETREESHGSSSSSLRESVLDDSPRSERAPPARVDDSTRVQTSACGQDSDCHLRPLWGHGKRDAASLSSLNGRTVSNRRLSEARGRVRWTHSNNYDQIEDSARAARRDSGCLVASVQEKRAIKMSSKGTDDTDVSGGSATMTTPKLTDTVKRKPRGRHTVAAESNPNSSGISAERGPHGQQHLQSVNSRLSEPQSEKNPENLKTGKSSNPTPITPLTPFSAVSDNSVFLSDDGTGEGEEPSVYYTPRPAFVFPDREPPLQSTALPAAEEESVGGPLGLSSLQHSHLLHLHPDQISAITDRSSSFMAVRLPPSHPGARLPPHQISAIPNISSSFMDIPHCNPFDNSALLRGHSSSFTGRDSSFPAVTPLRQGKVHQDSSYANEGRPLGDGVSVYSSAKANRLGDRPPSTIKKKPHSAQRNQNPPSLVGCRQNLNHQHQNQPEPLPSQTEEKQRSEISHRRNAPFQNQQEVTQNGGDVTHNRHDPFQSSTQEAHPVLARSNIRQGHLSQHRQRQQQPQHQKQQQQYARRSEASLVKEEDPAIMHVGQRVLSLAHRSSLNANALEFVPRGPGFPVLSTVPESLREDQEEEDRMQQGLLTAGNGARPTSRAQEEGQMKHAMRAQLPPPCVNPAAQHTALPSHPNREGIRAGLELLHGASAVTRPPPVMSMENPPSFPQRPVSNTALICQDANFAPCVPMLRSQPAAKPLGHVVPGTIRPPVAVSLPEGLAYARIPPRPIHADTSRHVTFADPSQPGKAGAGRRDPHVMGRRHNQPGHNAQRVTSRDHTVTGQCVIPVNHLTQASQSALHQHRAPTTAGLPPQGSVSVSRKRIGSGRFDEHARPPHAEAPVYAQHPSQREQLQHDNADHCYTRPPYSHAKLAHTQDSGRRLDYYGAKDKPYTSVENRFNSMHKHSSRAGSNYVDADSYQGREEHYSAESYRKSAENYQRTASQKNHGRTSSAGWHQDPRYQAQGGDVAYRDQRHGEGRCLSGGQQGRQFSNPEQDPVYRVSASQPCGQQRQDSHRGTGDSWKRLDPGCHQYIPAPQPAAYRQTRVTDGLCWNENNVAYSENFPSYHDSRHKNESRLANAGVCQNYRDNGYKRERQASGWNNATARPPHPHPVQYDSNCNSTGNRYTIPQQFRLASRPSETAEPRLGLNAVTIQPQTNTKTPEVTSNKGSDVKVKSQNETQTSTSAAKPSLRVRRGYIQLGLGDFNRPQLLRSVSDPSQ